ncbi:MAG: response regulator [Pseudomonadota bacterium]
MNPTLQGASVLVVEDEMVIAMAMQDYLTAAGAAQVDCVPTLKSARALVQNHDHDAVILDVLLRDGTCHGFARDLLDRGIPVIFHSGHAELDLTEDFPASHFCNKPSSPETVIGIVAKAISGG